MHMFVPRSLARESCTSGGPRNRRTPTSVSGTSVAGPQVCSFRKDDQDVIRVWIVGSLVAVGRLLVAAFGRLRLRGSTPEAEGDRSAWGAGGKVCDTFEQDHLLICSEELFLEASTPRPTVRTMRRSRRICCSATLTRSIPTNDGPPTSRTYGPRRAGCTWRS